MAYFLKEINSSNPVIIPIENEVIVGTNNMRLRTYKNMSKEHAVFYKSDDGSIFIKKYSNMHCVYVNDVKIESTLKRLMVGDIIGFGVKTNLTESGFVCILCYRNRDMPEIIEISDDDDDLPQIKNNSINTINLTYPGIKPFDVMKKKSIRSLNFLSAEISNSKYNISCEGIQPASGILDEYGPAKKDNPNMLIKKCSVPLMRCDSEFFSWPPDVKNPFLMLNNSFKANTDSSMRKAKNKLSHYSSWGNIRITESKSLPMNEEQVFSPASLELSFRDYSSDEESIICRPKKRTKRINSNSSVESSDFSYSPSRDNQSSFSKSCIKNPNTNDHLTANNFLNTSKKISSKWSAENVYHNLNLSNDLNKKIESSNCSNDQSSIHTDVGENLFQITFNVPQYQMKESNNLDSLDKENSYSQNEEIIDICSDDDDNDFKMMQNFTYIKTEPEICEDSEYDDIFREIFENSDEIEDQLPLLHSKDATWDNQEIESIETIKEYVKCSSSRDLLKLSELETKSKENIKLISEIDDQATKRYLDKEYVPTVSKIIYEKYKLDAKYSKSSNKTLPTPPKPLTFRPRYKIGRDEEYVERQTSTDHHSKRKRGRPTKKEQLEREASCPNLSVSTGKIPTVIEKHTSKHTKFATKALKPEKEAIKNYLFQDKDKKEKLVERKKLLYHIAAKHRGRSKKSFQSEYEKCNDQVVPQKCNSKAKTTVDICTNNFSNSKDSRKSTSSVKVRPEKFSSRIGPFLNEKVNKIPKRTKIPTKNAKCQIASNTEKSNGQHLLQSKIRPTSQNQTIIEKTCLPKIVSQFSLAENRHLKQYKSCSSHNLQKENLNISHFPVVNSNKISVSKEGQMSSELTFSNMVKSLIKFNAVWLDEQLNMPNPPKAIVQGVSSLPLKFSSYESYASSFYPLILLDIWQHMFESFKEISRNKMVNRFTFRVIKYTHKHDYIELNCESLVSEHYFEPREGTITVLEMNINSHQIYKLFGFICRHKIEPLYLDLLHPCWKVIKVEYLKNAKRWIFDVWIKSKELLLEPDILRKGNGICYIRNRLRLVDALCFFKNSPLLTNIIEPNWSTCTLSRSKSSHSTEYTSHQMEIIKAVCSEIDKPLECKITLLHGPAGTGKTHTIVGILETLFYTCNCNSNLQVLITAPSNIAVDEIGCRIIELNERYGWKGYSIKFVRVGVEKQSHPKMSPYFIDQKADELFKRSVPMYKQIEKDLQNLSSEISNLMKEPVSLNNKIQLKKLKGEYKHMKEKISLKSKDYKTQLDYKCGILKESHVVLSTLSSCSLSLLVKTFQPKSNQNFSCCIVDESTQSSELEILQPLALGISKLILIGDYKQLPAALSEYPKKYKYDRSMFERFCLYFESKHQHSPVLTLTEQFRMHPLICQFPSKYIYAEKLHTHPDTAKRYKEFPLNPYFILDLTQYNDPSLENKDCAYNVALHIYKLLQTFVDFSFTTGIIVPHEVQRSLYAKSIQFRNVEISTVNGFQGREKDIVILCAMEPQLQPNGVSFISCKRRFNVALTRAKKCLIVCFISQSLLRYSYWKDLLKDAQKRKVCFKVTSVKDISSVLFFSKRKNIH